VEEAKAREEELRLAKIELEAALAEVKAQEDTYHGKIADAQRRSEEGGAVSRGKAKNELAQLQSEDPLPLRKAKITLEAAEKRADKARAPFEAATKQAEAARAIATAAAQASTQARTVAERDAAAAAAARASAEKAAHEATQARKVAEADAKAASAARAAAVAAANQATADRHAAEQAAAAAVEAKHAAEEALEDARRQVAETEAYLEELKAKAGSGKGTIWFIERELLEAKKFIPTSKGGIAK